MAIEITPPPRGVYDWRVPAVLGGVRCTLQWRWNESWLVWTLRVSVDGDTEAGIEALVPGGLALCNGLLRRAGVPGTLRVVSAEERPGAAAFGSTARLEYVAP